MSRKALLENLRKCAACEMPTRLPLLPFPVEFNMRVEGMTYRQGRTDLDKLVSMTCKTVERFGYDWAMVFPDDYVEWESFGCEMFDEEDIPSTPTAYLPATHEILDNLRIPDFSEGRMPLHLEAIRQVRKNVGDEVCVASRIAPAFGAVCLLFGVEAVMVSLIDDKDFALKAMDKLADYVIRWARAEYEAGADILWVGDVLGASNFLSPHHFEEFVIPHAESTLKEIRKSGIFAIYHAAEKSLPHLQIGSHLPADAINVGEKVDIHQMRSQIDAKVCFSGNLDTLGTLKTGTPDQVKAAVASMIENNKRDAGYIFCTAEGVTQDTPEENGEAMMEEAIRLAPIA